MTISLIVGDRPKTENSPRGFREADKLVFIFESENEHGRRAARAVDGACDALAEM
jgi:hypothetical protein